MRSLLLMGMLCLVSGALAAQGTSSFFIWSAERQAPPEATVHLLIDQPGEQRWLATVGEQPGTVVLPNPAGTTELFEIWPTQTMAPELAARYPVIRTWAGRSRQSPDRTLRMEWSLGQWQLQVNTPTERWSIAPLPEPGQYALRRAVAPAQPLRCLTDTEAVTTEASPRSAGPHAIGEQLHTFRLAITTTAAFSGYHGGSRAQVLAAVVTLVNRVNEIYERDLAIHLELAAETDKLFFLDDATDPFSGTESQLIQQNHRVTVDSLGLANFDVGHLLDLNSSNGFGTGIASLRSVCSDTRKGRGYSATNQPVGDLFAVDFFAHELGHQFGARHTFNNCGAQGDLPYEPGGGSTIMAYAGLCGSQNVALSSIPYFHSANIQEITDFVTDGGGSSCVSTVATGNTAPVVTIFPPEGRVVPIATPLYLSGTATDLEDTTLLYTWEQYDLGPEVSLGRAEGNSPLFRYRQPEANAVRYLPNLPDLLAGFIPPSELLPTYTRGLTFRLVARDQHPIAGGVSWQTYSCNVSDAAGPFRVNSQGAPAVATAGNFLVVSWEVANTDRAPVSTDSVLIVLYSQSGSRLDTLARTRNDGRAVGRLPDDLVSTDSRVFVYAIDNLFFHVSQADLTVQPSSTPDIALTALESPLAVCAGDTARYTIYVAGLGGYTSSVNLSSLDMPNGINVDISAPVVEPDDQVTVTVYSDGSLGSGQYSIPLVATGTDVADTLLLQFDLTSAAPAPPLPLSPTAGETDVSTLTEIDWLAVAGADSYDLQLATDPDFMDLLYPDLGSELLTNSFDPPNQLPPDTPIFWRVRSVSATCGPGAWSAAASFVTEAHLCLVYPSTDTPLAFAPGQQSIISRLTIQDRYPIRDLNIRDLRGTFFPVGQLEFRLTGPAAAVRVIAPRNCSTNSFRLDLDDEALAALACPFNDGEAYRPDQPLSLFDGRLSLSQWRLSLSGMGTGGELTNWSLEICVPAAAVSANDPLLMAQRWLVFPNPGTDQLTLQWDQPGAVPAEFALYDLTGRRVFTTALMPMATGQATLNLPLLPAGLYLYRCIDGQGHSLASGRWVRQ